MIKYSYHWDLHNPKRVVTIARQLIREGDQAALMLGFAICSPRDQFTKERGRRIAQGRLERATIHSHRFLKKNESPIDLALETLYWIFAENRTTPSLRRILRDELSWRGFDPDEILDTDRPTL